MRFAQVPGYSQAFPVTYRNMYNDYSMVSAGLSDPFQPGKKESTLPAISLFPTQVKTILAFS